MCTLLLLLLLMSSYACSFWTQVKHDGFDLSCIEIRKEDLRKVYDYVSINDS